LAGRRARVEEALAQRHAPDEEAPGALTSPALESADGTASVRPSIQCYAGELLRAGHFPEAYRAHPFWAKSPLEWEARRRASAEGRGAPTHPDVGLEALNATTAR
jgi:hypothetical protein